MKWIHRNWRPNKRSRKLAQMNHSEVYYNARYHQNRQKPMEYELVIESWLIIPPLCCYHHSIPAAAWKCLAIPYLLQSLSKYGRLLHHTNHNGFDQISFSTNQTASCSAADISHHLWLRIFLLARWELRECSCVRVRIQYLPPPLPPSQWRKLLWFQPRKKIE